MIWQSTGLGGTNPTPVLGQADFLGALFFLDRMNKLALLFDATSFFKF